MKEVAVSSSDTGLLLTSALDWEATAQTAAHAADAAKQALARRVCSPLAWAGRSPEAQAAWERTLTECDYVLCAFLRDLFGNLFHSPTIDSSILSWNDGAVVRLTQAIYEG